MPFYVCFLDCKKAIDSVNRRILFTKLNKLSVSKHIFIVRYQVVVNSMVFINVDLYLTDKLPQNVGVPQGDRLAPILFTVFIANLDLFFKENIIFSRLLCRWFTPGIERRVKTTTSSVNSGEILRKKIFGSQKRKTQSNKITKRKRLCHYNQLTYRNTLLEFVKSFLNLLGVILQRNANPTKNVKHLRRKALVGTNTLSMKIDLAEVQLNTTKTIFEPIILPSAA